MLVVNSHCLLLSDYLERSAGHPIRWAPSLYPDLYTPTSPSWSLHWTFRDERLVNLPVGLLVEGDVIALRPGQEAFASLRGIKVHIGVTNFYNIFDVAKFFSYT